jgi:hypothetical protein
VSLPVPNIDDKRFDELVDEMLAAIPVYDPNWTDYNATDPGVTLVELFAWLADMLVYRANRVAPPQAEAFLRLINGPGWVRDPGSTLAEDIRRSVLALRHEKRAVTARDYEARIKEFSLAAERAYRSRIVRAMCLPHRDIDASTPARRAVPAPGTVSNIVLSGEEFAKVELTIGGKTTSATARAAIPAGLPIALPSAVGDCIDLALPREFGAILFSLAQAGRDYRLEFKYSSADNSWDAFAADNLIDYTFGWMQSGAIVFRSPSGWAKRTTPDDSEYWVRIECIGAPTVAALANRIVPRNAYTDPELLQAISADLEPRRLLGTRNVVGDPYWAPVIPDVLICAEPDQPTEAVRARICGAIRDFLDPWNGGSDGAGWPLGRAIYLSDMDQLLVGVDGVRQVLGVQLRSASPSEPRTEPGKVIYSSDGSQIGLWIADYQLPMALFDPARIVVGYSYAGATVEILITAAIVVAAAQDQDATVADQGVYGAIGDAVRRLFDPYYVGVPAASWLDRPWAVTQTNIRGAIRLVLAARGLDYEIEMVLLGEAVRRPMSLNAPAQPAGPAGDGALEPSFVFARGQLAALHVSVREGAAT